MMAAVMLKKKCMTYIHNPDKNKFQLLFAFYLLLFLT